MFRFGLVAFVLSWCILDSSSANAQGLFSFWKKKSCCDCYESQWQRSDCPPYSISPTDPNALPRDPMTGEPQTGSIEDLFQGDSFDLAGAGGDNRSMVVNINGDSSLGGSPIGVRVGNASSFANYAHPTITYSRLNISENNSPILSDRIFISHRRYENANALTTGGFSQDTRRSDFNLDITTFAIEKMLGERWSAEFRVPLLNQLSPNLNLSATRMGGMTTNNLDSFNENGRDSGVGNMSLIMKHLLYRNDTWYFSTGMAVNMPTADDVRISGTQDLDGNKASFEYNLDNETWELQPFFGALWTPNRRFFSQGFVQLDVPITDSPASISTLNFGDDTNSVVQGDVEYQTILRLNSNAGYWLYRSYDNSSFIDGIAAMIELHYATTINKSTTEVGSSTTGGSSVNDAFNIVAAIPIVIGRTTIYNAYTQPLGGNRDSDVFNFEYTLLIEHKY